MSSEVLSSPASFFGRCSTLALNEVVMVKAVAGAGKTTLLVELMKHHLCHKRVLYLVFNKKMRQETIQRLSGVNHVAVHTFHSLAYAYFFQSSKPVGPGGGLSDVPKGKKGPSYRLSTRPQDLKRDILRVWGEGTGADPLFPKGKFLYWTVKALDRAYVFVEKGLEAFSKSGDPHPLEKHVLPALRSLVFPPEGTGGKAAGSGPSARHLGGLKSLLLESVPGGLPRWKTLVTLVQWIWRGMCANVLPHTFETALKLLQLRGREEGLYKHFDMVCVDEAQDLLPVVKSMIFEGAWPIVLVGDTCQEINQWNGAVNAMENVPEATVLDMTMSYRFGASYAEAVKAMGHRLGWTGIDQLRGHPERQTVLQSAVPPGCCCWLARTNLQCLAWAIQHADKRLQLLPSTSQFFEQVTRLMTAPPHVLAFKRELAYHTQDANGLQLLESVETYRDALPLLTSLLKKTGKDVPSPEMIIGTIHASKGLEWDAVVLDPLWVKSLFAKAKKKKDPLPREELCLFYVGMTRARVCTSTYFG